MSTTEEVWRDVAGYGGLYAVSSEGRVRNKEYGRFVHGYISLGYRRATLCVRGAKYPTLIHRLVAGAFCERLPGCDVVNHLNANRADNRAVNLEWTTPIGNSWHMVASGRHRKVKAALNHGQCVEIAHIRTWPRGIRPTTRALAARYGVSQTSIMNAQQRYSLV